MLRSTRERIVQAVIYEAVALALVTPAYSWAMGVTVGNSLVTMVLVSLGVMIWSTIYNTVFDRALLKWNGRAAHQRTWGERAFHALLNEAMITLFAVPIIFVMNGKGWWAALVADIGFTVAYVVYTYVFHLIYDRLRPIATGAVEN